MVQGDNLSDSVTIQGNLLNYSDATTSAGYTRIDNSGASISLPRGQLTKTIYAINGNTNFGTAQVQPGDTVTYRIQYTLPASDIVGYQLSDYLPLPIFQVGTFTFNPVADASVPAIGQAKFGPADTFFGISGVVPAVSTSATGNSVTFNFGDYKDPQDRPSTTDILLTVQATDLPFADGLFLTNQAMSSSRPRRAGRRSRTPSSRSRSSSRQ